MERRVARLVVAIVFAVAVWLYGESLPVPYVTLSPSPPTDTLGRTAEGRPLIDIQGAPTFPTTGRLDLTVVGVTRPDEQLNLGDALRAWFDRGEAVVPRELVYPKGQSDDESLAQQAREMQESQESATTAALCQIRAGVRTSVLVRQVLDDGPSAGVLRPGDVITAVDGVATTGCGPDVPELVGRHQPGDVARVTYRRGDRETTAPIRTKPSGDRALIGIEVEEKRTFPFRVTIALRDVGGPSAGLMFALGIIDKLNAEDLTRGLHIAGTGTIDEDGNVGGIGGIQQKLVGARKAGARFFLTPAANLDAASAATPDGLTLLPVGTLAEALDALARLPATG